jgi:hypothetical protein
MWFYCTQLTSDKYGLFGQSHANQQDQLLHFQIRNQALYLGFFSDDLSGSISIQTNTWYHAAFVFDNSSLTQKIYLNGKLDSNRSSNTTCPTVAESRFFTFALQYLNTCKSVKVEYFQRKYKLDCSTHHISFIRFRSSFTILKVKYMPVTESPKMVMTFQCCVNNRKV